MLLRAADEERAASRCAEHGVWISRATLEALFAASPAGNVGGRVGRRLPPKREPRAPRLPSAFADRSLPCPRCRDQRLMLAGERWDCAHCEGSFVETAALERMLTEMTGAPWHLPPASGNDGSRACPICTAPLLVDVIEPVQVDRCPTHGVWFDPDELSTILAASTGVDERPTGTTAWLRRLIFFEDP